MHLIDRREIGCDQRGQERGIRRRRVLIDVVHMLVIYNLALAAGGRQCVVSRRRRGSAASGCLRNGAYAVRAWMILKRTDVSGVLVTFCVVAFFLFAPLSELPAEVVLLFIWGRLAAHPPPTTGIVWGVGQGAMMLTLLATVAVACM